MRNDPVDPYWNPGPIEREPLRALLQNAWNGKPPRTRQGGRGTPFALQRGCTPVRYVARRHRRHRLLVWWLEATDTENRARRGSRHLGSIGFFAASADYQATPRFQRRTLRGALPEARPLARAAALRLRAHHRIYT